MSTNIKEYLQLHPIDSTPYEDQREPVESRIFRILTRSKFRSAPLSEGTIEFTQEHIKQKVKAQQPITIVYPFGGGRGINTYNFPNVSWAEYLHLKFFIENIYPIGEIYEPGVEVKWSMDDYGAIIINNYDPEWPKAYAKGFRELLEYFNDLYEGVQQELIPTDTWYEFDSLKKAVVKRAKDMEGTPRAKELIKTWGNRAKRNFYNADNLEGKELQEAIEFSSLLNMAWLDHDFENPERGKYFESGLPIAHFTDFPDAFYIQVLPGCNVQFWKGNGYIEEKDGMLKSRIATRKVWKTIQEDLDFVENPLGDTVPDLGKLPILHR